LRWFLLGMGRVVSAMMNASLASDCCGGFGSGGDFFAGNWGVLLGIPECFQMG